MAGILYKWLIFSLMFMGMGGVGEKQAVTDRQTNRGYHPFYVSVTEINHNATDKTLEISCKMFSEDIEQTLEKNYKTTLDITVEKDKANFDKYLPDYLVRNLSLAVDGKAVKLKYIGYETEKESAYCYFEVENVSAAKKIDITNSILHDFTAEQINIMHVTVNGNRQSTKLNYPDRAASLSF